MLGNLFLNPGRRGSAHLNRSKCADHNTYTLAANNRQTKQTPPQHPWTHPKNTSNNNRQTRTCQEIRQRKPLKNRPLPNLLLANQTPKTIDLLQLGITKTTTIPTLMKLLRHQMFNTLKWILFCSVSFHQNSTHRRINSKITNLQEQVRNLVARLSRMRPTQTKALCVSTTKIVSVSYWTFWSLRRKSGVRASKARGHKYAFLVYLMVMGARLVLITWEIICIISLYNTQNSLKILIQLWQKVSDYVRRNS